MEGIEIAAIDTNTEILEGEFLPSGMSERLFGNLRALTDYIAVFNVNSGKFGAAVVGGQRVFVLQYYPSGQ